ncbi:hypothetical protein BaRGS_00036309 [Batillaria attramentaria]|uniref:Uncharacterized protein n=1 Tax=Batillaria attramentaria TaxID=370345 RepID=A0ABD0JCE2_9CAEN
MVPPVHLQKMTGADDTLYDKRKRADDTLKSSRLPSENDKELERISGCWVRAVLAFVQYSLSSREENQ